MFGLSPRRTAIWKAEVEAGRFRADLFFRLSAITLRLPPLRNRPHDMRLLAEHFLRAAAARYGRPAPRMTEDCLATLMAYSFPGNVRELESEMARLAVLASTDTPCGADLLNDRIRKGGKRKATASAQATPVAPMSSTGNGKTVDLFGAAKYGRKPYPRSRDSWNQSRRIATKLQRLQISEASDL